MAGTDRPFTHSMKSINKSASLIKDLLIGYCLGTANIIPGVSGGTFLLIFNIYERVFLILSNINKANTIEFTSKCTALFFKPDRAAAARELVDFLNENDFIFLLKLLAGSVAAIISLSSLMKYLIVYQFAPTYALFFGLILVSIIIPVKMLTRPQKRLAFFLALGMFATVWVTWAVNPYDKVEKKSLMYQAVYQQEKGLENKSHPERALSFSGKYTLHEYLYASACGAVSISAMILPGVSGSLVLILMGEYFEVVSAISGLKTLNLDNIVFLCCFGLGLVLGGLIFAKLINAVLKRYYNATMAFLTGLMAGSLYALWPFKKSIVMAEQYIKKDGVVKVLENVRVYTNINELPVMNSELYLVLAAFLAGCVIMFFFVKKEFQEPSQL